MLNETTSKAAYQLEAGVRALGKVAAKDLAEGAAQLDGGPAAASDAPQEMFSVLASLRRLECMMAGGAREAAAGACAGLGAGWW